jgi:hypothetical protein
MPLDNAGKNTAADAIAGAYAYLALFNSSDTELSGGSPAYARKLVTFGASSNGVKSITGTPYQFDVPSGATVAKFGLFTAVTGGTRGALQPLSATEGPYAAQGKYDFTAGSITVT